MPAIAKSARKGIKRMSGAEDEMPKTIKIHTFHCKSTGNSCDVWVDIDETENGTTVGEPKVFWAQPPSAMDAKLWRRRFYPEVCRRLVDQMPVGTKMLAFTDGRRIYRIEKLAKESVH
jgi:hypothetical protein